MIQVKYSEMSHVVVVVRIEDVVSENYIADGDSDLFSRQNPEIE